MAVRYYVDEDDDLLIGIASGLIAVDQLITALNKIITETNGAAFYKNHLFILEQDSLSSLMDSDALLRLRGFLESWGERLPGRNVRTVLLVSDPDFHPTSVKRWEKINSDALNYRANMRIMTDRDEAIAWLKDRENKSV